MSNQLELGTTVAINVPFVYDIGDEGNFTGKTLLTIEDCENEIREEINNGMNGAEVLLVKEVTIKGRIKDFIKEFCTEVYDMPDEDLELKMDDHKCIEWEEIEYFMPENNSSFTDEDDFIWDILNDNYHV